MHKNASYSYCEKQDKVYIKHFIVQNTSHLHSYPCFNQATTKLECMAIIFSHVLINQLLERCFISVSEPYLRLL